MSRTGVFSRKARGGDALDAPAGESGQGGGGLGGALRRKAAGAGRFLGVRALSWQIGRELRSVERRIDSMDRRLRYRLTKLVVDELDQEGGLPTPAGEDARRAHLARSGSGNAEVQIRGLCGWIVEALAQTGDPARPALQDTHRRVLRLVRSLREELEERRRRKDGIESYFVLPAEDVHRA